ncbi:hypothetical protein BDQ17DRAFT_1439681 [Cyathus striatus]|nr:hypothetical protein BDQ17DRAFT_1439681 [Cyathus striatus]
MQGDLDTPNPQDKYLNDITTNITNVDAYKLKNSRAALRIATLNIRGGGTPAMHSKWNRVHALMRDSCIGIMTVQETHITDTVLHEIQNDYPHLLIANSPDPEHPSLRGGVAIILHKGLVNWETHEFVELIPG